MDDIAGSLGSTWFDTHVWPALLEGLGIMQAWNGFQWGVLIAALLVFAFVSLAVWNVVRGSS